MKLNAEASKTAKPRPAIMKNSDTSAVGYIYVADRYEGCSL